MRREMRAARVRSPALREAFGAPQHRARGFRYPTRNHAGSSGGPRFCRAFVVLTITSVAVEELTVYDEPMTLAELRGPGWASAAPRASTHRDDIARGARGDC